MKHRYLILLLIGVGGALAIVMAAVVVLFMRDLDRVRQRSRDGMMHLAGFVAATLNRPDAPDAPWLGELANGAQASRIVVADSSGTVLESSHDLISAGDDLTPYLVDTALFDTVRISGTPRFTRVMTIDGVPFMSLYWPCRIDGQAAVVVVESDQQYFAASQRFGTDMVIMGLVVAALFCMLAGAAIAVNQRAQAAIERARANERLAFLGRTASELAHEIKNPMAIIKSSVDVLRKKLDPRGEQAAFGFISSEIMRLSRLIGDILGFSKEQPMRREPFGPAEALAAISAGLCEECADVNLAVTGMVDIALVGDGDAFRRILENLVRNAARAMDGRGAVNVDFSEHGKSLVMRVADTGPGVPAEVRDRIFEPFVSGSAAGTGLGLAIVKTLCDRNGWTIELAPSPQGACFICTFPEKTWQKS